MNKFFTNENNLNARTMDVNALLAYASKDMKKMPFGRIFNYDWFCVTSKSCYAYVEQEECICRVCEINMFAQYNGTNFDIWTYIENDDFEMFKDIEFVTVDDALVYVNEIIHIEEIEES